MKPGRNEPCPCGSGKKYKRCCMNNISKQHASILDDIEKIAAMNPTLSLDELNLVAQQKAEEGNNRAQADFCGLSSSQMFNWLYAPFNEIADVTIGTPDDLSTSPVMRYLSLILDEAMKQEGSFKVTTKGNLPTKLVKQASELLPEFAVAEFKIMPSISEFSGSNEDNFNVLHYTRILADVAGIIYFRSGRLHVKKSAQKQYQTHGLKAFFLPMLEAATSKYNWCYFDAMSEDVELQKIWLFMLWRLQTHASVSQLIEEVEVAFPDLLNQFAADEYFTPEDQLRHIIESRFVERFLQFWGFVTMAPRKLSDQEDVSKMANIQPLLKDSFTFLV